MRKIIPFLVFCLVATCNADLRTWTAVNGKEVEAEFVSNEKGIVKLKLKSGKIFEVPANKLSKEDNEIISSLAKPEKNNPKPDGVNRKELELREDIWYLRGAEFSYTGKSYLLHKNGLKKRVENYKNGKKDGVQIHWHENGQKSIEANYKNGKWEGPWLSWNENGQKKSEANYKDGKADGLWLMWHKNGQKMVEGKMKNGKWEELVNVWHKNGQKREEINYKNGKPVEGSEKFWNSKGEPVNSEEEAFAE